LKTIALNIKKRSTKEDSPPLIYIVLAKKTVFRQNLCQQFDFLQNNEMLAAFRSDMRETEKPNSGSFFSTDSLLLPLLIARFSFGFFAFHETT